MNCLLVAPQKWPEPDSAPNFPLGMGLISAALASEASLKLFHHNLTWPQIDAPAESILPIIERENIGAVLCGGHYTNFHSIREVFSLVKKFHPTVFTITGGLVVTGDPLVTMEALEYGDYGIIGEGEESVVELCAALAAGKSPESIRGLVLKDETGRWFETPPRPPLDYTKIPWCDIDSFGYRDFLASDRRDFYGRDAVYYPLSSRGCTMRCTFCHNSQGKTYRPRPLDDFFRELEWRIKNYGPDRVDFMDDLLAQSPARLEEFCKRIEGLGLKGWRAQMRIPQINETSLALLKKAGCGQVFVGLESASDHILKSMRKGSSAAQMEKALALCLDMELPVMGNFIFGDSEETIETAQETLAWWKEHRQYFIFLFSIIVMPGSELYRHAVSAGRLKDPVKYLRQGVPPINVSKMSDQDFDELIGVTLPDLNTELLKDKRHHLKDMTLLPDFTTMHRRVNGVCRYCGRLVDIAKVSMFYVNGHCRHCGAVFWVPQLSGVEGNMTRNLESLAQRYGGAAFWGIGNIFELMVGDFWPALVSKFGSRLRLVDSRRAGLWRGQPIQSPAEISGGAVVVCAMYDSPIYRAIMKTARSEPKIQKVVDIFQLQEIWHDS